MNVSLTPLEARIIACLIEKQISTPDQYPLSLNALTNACNQKSNRDPVMDLDDLAVQRTLDDLMKRNLVMNKTGFGSRVTKYQHRFCNTEFGTYKFSPQELGILCELMLRGPQTPGELRTHTDRLCKFADMQEVDAALHQLGIRDDGPFIVKLAREPGKRESRYAQLFCGEPQLAIAATETEHESRFSESSHERLDRLEQTVAELRDELERIKQSLETR
jgi:hypothetical protein